MVSDNAKLLLRLLWRPADAMSGILDQGSLLFASVAVLAVSLARPVRRAVLDSKSACGRPASAQPQETEQDEPALPLAHAQPGGRSASMLRYLSWLWCMFPGRCW